MDLLCAVSLAVFSLLTPILSSRPESSTPQSPVVGVYFFTYFFLSVLLSPFPHEFASYPLVNFFNVFWIGCASSVSP